MKTLAATLITALISVSAMAQYKLEYKVSPPLHYNAHSSLETTQTMMDRASTYSMSMQQSISMTSTKKDDDIVFSITIDSSEIAMIGPSGDTSKIPSPMVGKVKETRIHPDGEEISTRWLDTSFASTAAGQMRDFGSLFFKLPSQKVDAGATWHQDKVDTAGTPGGEGKIIVNTGTDYKLIRMEKYNGASCARIEFTSKIDMGGSTTAQGMEFTISGTGTLSGFVLFDYDAGKLMKISGASNQQLNMTSSGQQPMTIPMSQKANYEFTLSK